jgi:hypothetical protein
MTKYLISWTEEEWYEVIIDASSRKEALDMFHDRMYDEHTIYHSGGELQDNIGVTEL